MLSKVAGFIFFIVFITWLVVPFAINSIDDKLSKILKIMEGDEKDGYR